MQAELLSPTSTQQLDSQERFDWLRLYRTERIGPQTFFQLIARYGTAGEALLALPELSRKGGAKSALEACKKELVEQELAALETLGARLIAFNEAEYPALLRTIADPPAVFAARGNTALLGKDAVAMVGTRNPTVIGQRFARSLSGNLAAEFKQVIVSGLARGIDGAAHEGALFDGGATIAVLGSGVDIIYPKEHDKLYAKILAEGSLIISETPAGMEPRIHDFPKRNRIISGLSHGVVVVEANMRSGSLITARLALEQGREVMAVPGFPKDPRASGPNRLLKQGAALVENAEDVMHTLNYARMKPRKAVMEETGNSFLREVGDKERATIQQKMLSALSHHAIGIDELAAETGYSASVLRGVLLEMELAGRVITYPGGEVSLA